MAEGCRFKTCLGCLAPNCHAMEHPPPPHPAPPTCPPCAATTCLTRPSPCPSSACSSPMPLCLAPSSSGCASCHVSGVAGAALQQLRCASGHRLAPAPMAALVHSLFLLAVPYTLSPRLVPPDVQDPRRSVTRRRQRCPSTAATHGTLACCSSLSTSWSSHMAVSAAALRHILPARAPCRSAAGSVKQERGDLLAACVPHPICPAVVTPIILPFGLLYFLMWWPVWRYQML